MLGRLNAIAEEARAWGEAQHPQASPQHHAAFMNSVVYARTHFTGPYGGPSLREHTASRAVNEHEGSLDQCPVEEVYRFLEPIIYGPLTDLHVLVWDSMRGICFDDDPQDIRFLNEQADQILRKHKGLYLTTQLRVPTLMAFRRIAHLNGEPLVAAYDRLADAELARLGLLPRQPDEEVEAAIVGHFDEPGEVTPTAEKGYRTTRMWARSLQKYRLIAALNDEEVAQSLERLASQELARKELQGNEKEGTHHAEHGAETGTP